MSPATVSQKLSKGMNPEEIIQQGTAWAQAQSVKGRRKDLAKPQPRPVQPVVKRGRVYTPARKVSTLAGPGPAIVDALSVTVPVGKVVNDANDAKVKRLDGNRGGGRVKEVVPAGMVAAALSASRIVSSQGETYQQAELRKMIGAANLQEIKAEQLRGELVNKAQVNYVIGTQHVKFRDHLFRLPDELRDSLAFEDDPVKTGKILMDALVQVCSHLRVLLEEMPDLPEDLLEGKADGAQEAQEAKETK